MTGFASEVSRYFYVLLLILLVGYEPHLPLPVRS